MRLSKIVRGRKLKRIKFEKVSQKRLRKLLKRRKRYKYWSKTRICKRNHFGNKENLYFKNVILTKPIFRLFDKNNFYKKPNIKDGVAYIVIPDVFSFAKNAYNTINVIKEIAYAARNGYSIFINHSFCGEIDLAASLVMDSILIEYKNVTSKLKLKVKLAGQLSNNAKVNDILKFSGILHNLDIEKTKDNSRFQLLPLTKNENSGIMTTKIIDYYKNCLNTKGYTLSPKGELYFSKMIGEVINNCSDHGGNDVQWYALGHYFKSDGECNLAIFDFGDTIYNGLKNNVLSEKTTAKLQKLTSYHKNLFSSVDEELLWTLFSLQHGISRLNSCQDETRGQGTIDLIDSFQKLGMKYDNGKIEKPIMSIVSGNISILFDGKYSIQENEDELKVIAFNSNNDLKMPPDNKYVKNIHNFFPGTIISIRFFIDRQYIQELKGNE